MIIGIDGNEANIAKRVGIGEYSFELLKQFREFQNSNYQFQIYLKDKPLHDMPKEDKNWRYRILRPGKLWTQWRLPLDLYLNNPKPDVFFTPSHYAPRFSPVPTVISVMDIAYIHFPHLFDKSDLYQLHNWTKYSIKKASKVLTISESSKNDIIKEYGVASENVAVTYPGVKENVALSPHIYAMNQLKMKYEVTDNYILFVGTLQPRKNIKRLIEAFAEVIKNKKFPKDLQLVIIGKKGWQYEEILEAPGRLEISERVLFLESIGNEELPEFYKHALCMVLPSLYEGFGLPVLEAMKYDCPVITSNVSSLPEAGGDACLYVDPEDTLDIADKITKLLASEKLREELKEKGRKQLQKFSWEKTARETLKILEETAA